MGTVASAGTYKLCVRKSGGSDSVEQSWGTMTVVAATPTNVITGSTASISAGHATDVTLTGTIASGDLVIWTTGSCGSVTPNVDPTDGTNAVTSMTVASAGTYKLCVRKSGGSDGVEQSGFTLSVS